MELMPAMRHPFEELLFRRKTVDTTEQLRRLGLSEDEVRAHYDAVLARELQIQEVRRRPAGTRHVEAAGVRQFLMAQGPSLSAGMRATLKRTLQVPEGSPEAKRPRLETTRPAVPATIRPIFPSHESQKTHNMYAQAIEVIQGLLRAQNGENVEGEPSEVRQEAGGSRSRPCVAAAPLIIPAGSV